MYIDIDNTYAIKVSHFYCMQNTDPVLLNIHKCVYKCSHFVVKIVI